MESTLSKYYFLKKDFFSNDLSIKYLLSIFFNTYLFIVFFDVTRDSLAIPRVVNLLLSAIRDFSIYSLIIYIIVTKKSVVSGYKAFYIAMYCIIPIIMWFSNLNDGISIEHPFGTVLQFCILSAKPFMFLYVLQNIDLYYVFEKKNIIKTFISIMTFMVITSFGVYFLFPSLIIKYNIENRVGLGNMSIQAGLYCCAYFLCLYYYPFKSNKKNYFCIMILLAGVALSVCSTGILSILAGTALFAIDKRSRKRSLLIILSISALCIFIVIRYYSLFSAFFDYFKMKWDNVLDLIAKVFSAEEHKTKSVSFHARELQIENMLTNHNALMDRPFGHGYFSITERRIFVENAYYAIYFDCGFFGVILLGIIILTLGIKALKLWFYEKSYIGIATLIAFCFFMTTLDISIGPAISSAFVFLIYVVFHKKDYCGKIIANI